jgi:general secretion pathway protein D
MILNNGERMNKSLKVLQVFAVISYLLGLTFLIFIMNSKSGYSAPNDPQPGFQPGVRTFNNPYVPANGNAALEEDDEDYDIEDYNYTPPARGSLNGNPTRTYNPDETLGNAGTGNSGNLDSGRSTRSGITIGGSPSSVTLGAQSNKQAALQVDLEGATGSNEIITDFNFPDADVLDIAKALGRLTGKNFIYDKGVTGKKISIVSNSPVTVKNAWRAFLTALDINGLALVPSGDFTRITLARDARDKQLRTFASSSSPDSDALITRIFQLKYLTADEVARNFRSFMPTNSRIIPYDQTNTVIVTDTGSNISKMQKFLEILDVEGYDAGIEVIQVKHASATSLAGLINDLLPGNPVAQPGGSSAPRFGGFSGGSGGKFSARRTKEGGVINNIIADDRTNNLIVHANAKGVHQVKALLAKLDKKLTITAGGGKVNVVYLQFADAEKVAATLNNITQAAQQSRSPASPSGAGAGIGVNPVQASLFEGNVKIAPDAATNSLVITASPMDFATIQQVINRLDIARDQVYSEVVVMEVSTGNNFEYSANIANPANGIGSLPKVTDLASFVASPLAVAGGILGFTGGKKVDITLPNGKTASVGSVVGLIKAISGNGQGSVLATPQIMSMDNEEAKFESTTRIPVKKEQTANNVSTTTFDYQDVKLSIAIKPQINKMTNFVKLKVDTKIADISTDGVPAALQDQAIATLRRRYQSRQQ